MLNYIEYLNMPTKVITVLICIFFVMQVIGEILEFKGKVVPEFIKIRKYFKRKREEHYVISQMPNTLKQVQDSLNDFKSHYDQDNITKRDTWIHAVDGKLEQNDRCIKTLDEKLNKSNQNILTLLIESKRDAIINFASYVADDNTLVTREQYTRMFKIYKEYETIIKENNLTNGEIDIAFRIIQESYEERLRTHAFIEDIRGYDTK